MGAPDPCEWAISTAVETSWWQPVICLPGAPCVPHSALTVHLWPRNSPKCEWPQKSLPRTARTLAVAGESDEWPNRTPSFRLGVGLMDKLPGDVWHATGHLDWVLLATLALGFGVQKWARVPI